MRSTDENFVGPRERAIPEFGGVLFNMLSVIRCWKYINNPFWDNLFYKIDRMKQQGKNYRDFVNNGFFFQISEDAIFEYSGTSGDDYLKLKIVEGLIDELKLFKQGKLYDIDN